MEAWQKEIINKNLHGLVETTTVNITFLSILKSKNVLSSEDIEILENEMTASRRAFTLYDILLRKSESFNVLRSALEKTKQSGALQILDEAIVLNSPVDSENINASASDINAVDNIFTRCVDKLDKYISPAENIKLLIITTNDRVLTITKLKNTLTFTHCNHIKIKEISSWRQLKLLMPSLKSFICTSTSKEDILVCVLYDSKDGSDDKDIATKVKECIQNAESYRISKNKKVIIVASTTFQKLKEFVAEHQTDAVRIEVIEDNFKWEQLNKSAQSEKLEQEVYDHGRLVSLKLVCSSLMTDNKNQFMREFLNGKLLIDLLNYEKVPVVFHKTIPVTKKKYISRTISCRNNISKNIFLFQPKFEIFAFSGVASLAKLKKLSGNCNNGAINAVKNIFDENPQLMPRFLLLEQESDYEKICKKAATARLTVHKIAVDIQTDRLYWTETRGNDMEVLQLNVLESSEQTQINEKYFLKECAKNNPAKPVILCGSPGMGRSFLMASLATQTRSGSGKLPIVLYIVMSDFICAFKTKQNADTEGSTADRLGEILQEEILSRISPYYLNPKTLLESSKYGPKVHLFFDGLDNVSTKSLALAFDIFKHIEKYFNGTKIYIATRPNLLNKLERSLGVLGYSIDPFSTDDQIKFLVDYWSVCADENTPEINEERLVEYAKKFLKKMGKGLSKNEGHIAGVPLYCSLLAELFAKEAVEVAYPRSTPSEGNVELEPTCKFSTITNLYEQIVKRKFEAFKENYISAEYQIFQPVHLEDLHAFLSIQTIFADTEWPEKLRSCFLTGELFNSLRNMFSDWNVKWQEFADGQLPKDELVKIGLVEYDEKAKQLKFTHRTFAEYFLAQFTSRHLDVVTPTIIADFVDDAILETFTTKTPASKQHPLFPDLFRFKLPVVTNFINDMLLPINVQPPECEAYKVVAASLKYEKILHACIHNNCSKLLQLYFNHFNNKNGLSKTMLLLAASYSTPDILELLGYTLQSLDIHQPLLHAAAERGSYPVLAHLYSGYFQGALKTWSRADFRDLIIACLVNTRNSDSANIHDRCKILDLLADDNLNQLVASLRNHLMVIMDSSVRPKLLLHLMAIILSDEQTVDDDDAERINLLGEIDSDQRTVLHKAAEFFSESQYIKFLQILKQHQDAIMRQLCMFRDVYQQTPLHYLVRFLETNSEICDIFAEYETDFNNHDISDFNVISTAIRSGRSFECVADLMNMIGRLENANVNRYQRSLLHIAAQYSTDVRLFEQLIRSGININLSDTFGNTPVFYAIRNINVNAITTIQFFHGREANLEHRNMKGETILHWASESGNVKMIELLFKFRHFESSPVDSKGNTAMHWALRANIGEKLETIKLLHEKFPDDVNAENRMNQCPLTYGLAARHPDVSIEVIQYLEPKVNNWTTNLVDLAIQHLTCVEGESTVCRTLIETIQNNFANV